MAEESPLRRRVTWEFVSSRCQQVCSLATFSVKRTGTSIRGGGSYRKHMAQRSFRRVLWSQLRLTSLSPSPSTQSRLRVLGPPFCGCRVQSMRWVQGELLKISAPRFRSPDKDDAVPTVRKQRSTGDAMAAQRAAAGGNRYTVQRSLRGMSRTDVRWGPRLCSTAPGQDPPLLLHQISLWGRRSVETRAERRCDACGGMAEFFNRRGRAGADGEGAAVEERCDGGPASGGGWESVRSTTHDGGLKGRAEDCTGLVEQSSGN
jgi:hypothetical protein